MNTKLEAIITKVEELRKVMKGQGKEAVKGAFADFFQDHPEAKAIVWTQYTPYFNDGDACVFRVNELELKANVSKVAPDVAKLLGEDPETTDDDEDNEESYGYGEACLATMLGHLSSEEGSWYQEYLDDAGVERRDLTAEEQSLVDDFDGLVEAANKLDEVFELVFGDHCQVTATRDGFDVTEYDHD